MLHLVAGWKAVAYVVTERYVVCPKVKLVAKNWQHHAEKRENVLLSVGVTGTEIETIKQILLEQ